MTDLFNGYTASYDTGNSLAHYGVKGMRWGVRRGRKARSAAQRARKIDPSTLSDAELNAHILRMQREQQYKQLSGRKSVGERLGDFGKREARQIMLNALEQEASSQFRKGLKKGGRSIYDRYRR